MALPWDRLGVGAGATVAGAVTVMLVAVGAVASSAAVDSGGGGDRAAQDPPCFGAAARDPERPCENPALRYSVVPSPSDARIDPSAPCTPVPQAAPPDVCAFGAAPAAAGKTFALVGDSHAVHWRAALDVIARQRGWHFLNVTRAACPFTSAVVRLREPGRSQCVRWGRQVVRWFHAHPEVHTVFVSAHATASVVVPDGEDPFEGAVAAYARAWEALPPSVEHIVVIRDPPYIRNSTLGCVARALARRTRPGRACASPRTRALSPDPAMQAARRMGSPRVQGIDMTRFFCGDSLCYPVIGGALVNRDKGHITRVYASTTAPFVRRKLLRLMASW